MLLNRTLENVRIARARRALRSTLERDDPRRRCTLVVVPSLLGTRLADGEGHPLWGDTQRLFRGPSIARAAGVVPQGLLEGFELLPGLLRWDVYGGMVRFLEEVGGYRLGSDLFVLDYDWRTGVVDAATRLAALVDELHRDNHCRLDLMGFSSGGMVVRYFAAFGGSPLDEVARATPPANVRRLVFVGTPQRGAMGALWSLVEGTRLVAGGRKFDSTEIAGYQTVFDMLPHPDQRAFIDKDGDNLELSLYDADVWARYKLTRHPDAAFAARLARARALHRAFDLAPAVPDAVVIGARNQPTVSRMVVRGRRASFPPCKPRRRDPLRDRVYEPGDTMLSEASLTALPGVRDGRIWFVSPRLHHDLPSHPAVHRMLVEALVLPVPDGISEDTEPCAPASASGFLRGAVGSVEPSRSAAWSAPPEP